MSQMLVTFILVVFGWIIFRAESISQAWHYVCGIFTPSLFQMPEQFNKMTILMILLMLGVEWWNRDRKFDMQINSQKILMLLRYGIYSLLIFVIYFCGGSQETFIYFQF
jgi:alginate O-acetyltransferase complex protein AlgI